MHTIRLVPFREHFGPSLHRKVENIADNWIARGAWGNALVALSEPLAGNSESSQGDTNADGRGGEVFARKHGGGSERMLPPHGSWSRATAVWLVCMEIRIWRQGLKPAAKSGGRGQCARCGSACRAIRRLDYRFAKVK